MGAQFQFVLASVLIWVCSFGGAWAQPSFPFPTFPSPSLPALKLPEQASEWGMFSRVEMGLYKPKGEGPFPALVLGPTCAGPGRYLSYWIQAGIDAGYAVLLLDSMAQRGETNICGRRAALNYMEGTKDAMDALQYLSGLSWIDAKRVVYAGYSWGGAVAYLLASKGIASQYGFANVAGLRYAATAGLYPVCYHPAWGVVSEIALMRPDTDRPLLALMGEDDHEEPTPQCVERLQALKDAGAPVQWHVFKKTTHAWDNRDASGKHSKMPWMPQGGQYRYDAKVTEQSRDLLFGFFSDVLSQPRTR